MPIGTITRGPIAHVDAQLTNAQPDGSFGRDDTGRVTGRLTTYNPGER
ncbi:hypothetical protein [Halostagnicola sp. A56]|nr:hypothetical protein [Halostagnicola sp. A56]